MTPFDLLVLSLCVWYIGYVLIKTSGPFNVFAQLRAFSTIGGLLLCLYCLVPWVGLAAYLLYMHTAFKEPVYVGAIAGAAMILHRYTGGDHG